jgi:pseudouridylate synthase I
MRNWGGDKVRNIKIVIEYDGTNYGGWQKQNNAPTIQQELEEGIYKLTGERVSVIGSGRTDSGVHARGQVANFMTNSSLPPGRFSYALNSVLPKDILILSSQEVSPEFHARYSAIGKRYRYSIIIHPHGTAIGRNYYYHLRQNLDIDAMKKATHYFIGTHDFKAFQASGSLVENTIRTIDYAKLTWEEPFLYFDIAGNGFLYNMVRIIVGTLILVGQNKIGYEDVKKIIESKDRRLAGPTAPAHGLCLEEVYY